VSRDSINKATEIPFAKLQGAGNGYIAIDGRALSLEYAALARAMADPVFGVGSDGLLIVEDSSRAQIRMRIFNSDGSESEMSGNGVRLFAKFVLDRGIVEAEAGALAIETGGGVRTVWPTIKDGAMSAARVAMGTPTFDPKEIPIDAQEQMIEATLVVGDLQLNVTCLAIGNPHAVAILEQDVATFPLAEIGPLVQNHPLFPNRVNFEIVNVMDENDLRVRVFERGEGETASSGTGSTASMIATRLSGRCADQVKVHLAGGELAVAWPGEGEAFLTGPAVEVFTGVWRGGGA
jgi:diaminopimelate epimerase